MKFSFKLLPNHFLTALTLLLTLSVPAAVAASTHLQSVEVVRQGEMLALQAALDSRKEIVSAFKNRDFESVAKSALEKMIAQLVKDLEARNDAAMAQELTQWWGQTEALFGTGAFALSLHDLGDHAPLFAWLEDFLTRMSDKYGAIVFSLPYVKDIRTLNFALPVVFQPRGAWQKVGMDHRIEYRKHFIPFANLATYYISLYSCKAILTKQGLGQLTRLCGKAASKLQFVMGRYIAPHVSDWVFKLTQSRLEIRNEDMRYGSAEELKQAIRASN